MAFVRVYFHRQPKRVAPHVRYIAGRDGSRGLRGLGADFRALHGDVERSIALLREQADVARTRAGPRARDGPFVRLLFTLPDGLAERAMAADAHLPQGSELVLRDALEATFRSAGRHLQGVYALHFHATGRRAHPHAHVDLSPLDAHGRGVFLTGRQRELLRATWEREIERALDRAERRARAPRLADAERLDAHVPPRDAIVVAEQSARTPPRQRPRGTPRAARASVIPNLASILLGSSGMPLLDLFTRALLARARARVGIPLPTLSARHGLGLRVPLPDPQRGPLRLFRRPALTLRLP